MRSRRLIYGFVLFASAAGGGCRMLGDDVSLQGQSPLVAGRASPDSVAIEMLWVRFPDDDPQLNDEAWLAIDETAIAADVRRELAANGFRVGVISGDLPDAMARALNQTGGAPEDEESNSVTHEGVTPLFPRAEKRDRPLAENGGRPQSTLAPAVGLLDEPVVRGRVKHLRRHERWEIQASDVYPSLPLLEPKGREQGGDIYPDAQALYALRIDPQPDRTVLVELTPELHFGPYHQSWSGDERMMMRALVRDRRVFAKMQINVRLAAGDILVLMNLPNSGSRLGEYFHTVDSSQGRQQKLILLRLAQLPPGETFAD
jgi:hypothetical protein